MSTEADVAVLKSKVKLLEENQNVIFERIRTNERWIAGAGAVLTTGMAILGLVAAVDAKTTAQVNQIEYESTGMCLSGKSCQDIEKGR
tara:strand:- start:65 stop:328 length:264 start_codon:yes stop_codon:yes gene_type:complete